MRIFFLLFTVLLCSNLQAQQGENFSRVRIDLTKHEISEISRLGLETDHGQIAPGKHLVNDFSESEIQLLKDNGIAHQIEIRDVKKWYREQGAAEYLQALRSAHCDGDVGAPEYDYETPENYTMGSMAGYFTYAEFLSHMDQMVAKYPNLISPKTQIGDFLSHEGRPIYSLRISDNPNVDEDEPEVLYTAIHHAREPNSLSSLIFYMWYLLENYEDDPEIKFIVDETELYFIPMINPDGYIHNEVEDPEGGGLWRKNKWVDPESGVAYGVDPNRNYGYKWALDDEGSSPSYNAPTFRGLGPFSEPETQAVKFLCEAHEFQLALNIHCYGNYLIHPWGFEDLLTEDDASYKAIGNVLNAENGFLLGTTWETIGYLVNGDSDDWMHGEETTKNKIISYTPEIGPGTFGFWPPSGAIDELNKSAFHMHRSLANMAHNYLLVKDLNAGFLTPTDNMLQFFTQQVGLQDGMNTVTLSSSDPDILISNASIDLDMNHLDETTINFPFEFSTNFTAAKAVTLTMTIDNGIFVRQRTFDKTFSPVDLQVQSTNEMNNTDDIIISQTWGLTEESFTSAPTSLTDSPNSDYSNQKNTFVIFTEAHDLTNALLAFATFDAKWDIEDDYDYVQVLAGTSTDINMMTPLCGNYTDLGSSDQAQGQPLYDGFQPGWIQEQLSLEDFLGEPAIYFGLRFRSDNFVTGDGFYMDNFSVEVVNDEDVANENLYANAIDVFPNPFTDIISISAKDIKMDEEVQLLLTDVSGKVLIARKTTGARTDIELSSLPAGAYFLELKRDEESLYREKVVKL